MKTLSNIIEELKKSKSERIKAVGTKRAADISESFDICINVIMDFAAQFENEIKKERVKAYYEGKEDGINETKSKLYNIIQQLEEL
jgi:archaellum component FlaC